MKALLSLALLILSVTFALAQAATTAKCPAITIIGPAGVEMPWDAMTFQVSLTGEVPKRLAYKWDVVGGAIMGGQGTPELKARYINVSKFLATVTVVGLPSGCPTTAFEPLSMTGPEPGPVHLGTINNSTYTIDEALLEKIREALTSNDGSQLYVWLYT